MAPSFKINKLEAFAYSILFIILLIGLYFSFKDALYFNSTFAAEDGIIEWLTFIFLVSSVIVLSFKAYRNWTNKPRAWKLGITILAILFFFGAGEEISWGQRIFNVESSSFFSENNLQQETNLHNLTIGKISLNKLIFSQVILGILLLYILILPLAYLLYYRLQKIVDDLAIPIMEAHHVLAFIIASVIILSIPADRKWELYELCFSVIFLLIFYKPFNNWIYKSTLPNVY